MKPKIIGTKDGSHTLYVKELDENYHSRYGAVTESLHVYIKAGLKSVRADPINILEMGFGTGLNAFLTLHEIRGSQRTVHYTGIEKYPLEDPIINALNYNTIFPADSEENIFKLLHQSPWNRPVKISERFILEKIETDFLNLDDTDRYDLVYYDAFGPDKQPELWSTEIFMRVYKSMKQGGLLTTYSTKGQMRRNLVDAGFRVEKLPGPPGKFDMTRAWRD